MNELALFAGGGGGILGSVLLGHRVVCAVEIDPYCREVLMARQEDGCLPPFPIWDDVRTFDGKPWRGIVDVVSAGFPCQPFSIAGQKRGEADERNLWPGTARIIREVEPRYAFLENVPGLVATDYFGEILGDLGEAGFDAEWGIVSAAEVGAPHRRERIWVLATNADVPRCEEQREQEPVSKELCKLERSGWWTTEPGIRRVDHGVANRVGRLTALGNGQVPGVVREAWRRLS